MQFQQAQDLFRQGLNSEELRLMVIKHPNNVEQISTVEIISRDEKENMVHSEEKSMIRFSDQATNKLFYIREIFVHSNCMYYLQLWEIANSQPCPPQGNPPSNPLPYCEMEEFLS